MCVWCEPRDAVKHHEARHRRVPRRVGVEDGVARQCVFVRRQHVFPFGAVGQPHELTLLVDVIHADGVPRTPWQWKADGVRRVAAVPRRWAGGPDHATMIAVQPDGNESEQECLVVESLRLEIQPDSPALIAQQDRRPVVCNHDAIHCARKEGGGGGMGGGVWLCFPLIGINTQ